MGQRFFRRQNITASMKKYLQPEEKITVCRVDKKDLRSRNRPQLTADLNNFIKKNSYLLHKFIQPSLMTIRINKLKLSSILSKSFGLSTPIK